METFVAILIGMGLSSLLRHLWDRTRMRRLRKRAYAQWRAAGWYEKDGRWTHPDLSELADLTRNKEQEGTKEE